MEEMFVCLKDFGYDSLEMGFRGFFLEIFFGFMVL